MELTLVRISSKNKKMHRWKKSIVQSIKSVDSVLKQKAKPIKYLNKPFPRLLVFLRRSGPTFCRQDKL